MIMLGVNKRNIFRVGLNLDSLFCADSALFTAIAANKREVFVLFWDDGDFVMFRNNDRARIEFVWA